MEVGIFVLGSGVYEIGGVVEEVRVLNGEGDEVGGFSIDGAKGGKDARDRRVWVTERPCVLIARDEEGDGELKD